MEWIKIERYKEGFATSDALDKMYNSLPVIVTMRYLDSCGWEEIETEYIDEDTWERGEYEWHTKYAEYIPVPPLKIE